MTINEETVAAHFELMTKPKDYDLPFRAFEDCFEPSDEVTAQHILYRDYRPENPNCQKIFFYIVLQKVYGPAHLKDKDGNLGFPMKYKEIEENDLNWEKAFKHFSIVRKSYQDLAGTPGVNTSFALEMVFRPLAERYESGERTKELYDAMMEVE